MQQRTFTDILSPIFLVIGAGLSIGAIAYESADQLTTFPETIVTVAAVVAIILAVFGLAGSRGASSGGVLLGAVLGGWIANYAVYAVHWTHEFRNATILLVLGGLLLLAGAVGGFVHLLGGGVPRAASATAFASGVPPLAGGGGAAASQATGVAPAGWYPDPEGGAGQRYWDGSAWGQRWG